MDIDLTEFSRLLRSGSAWERNFRRYCQLLDAGIPEKEAAEICTDILADVAVQDNLREAA
jgi:hypothetical protein